MTTKTRHKRTWTGAWGGLAAALLLALVACAAAYAAARPHISSVRCVGACAGRHVFSPGGSMQIAGTRFRRGTKAYFTVRRGKRRMVHSASTRVNGSKRLTVRVPGNAISGTIYVVVPHAGRSNKMRVTIKRLPHANPPPQASGAAGTAFAGTGMWIWYVSQSSGGTAAGIIQQAQQYGVTTVFVKSSDGTNYWSQFNAPFVSQLKAAGLHVCAWQYVYGSAPAAEAALGTQAVQAGADCLAIDAEAEYEGRYAQAQQYIASLRQAIGASYPVALASFPYVDYHPSFPYSVFMGPNGAQFNAPQVYWKAIGVSVDSAVNHTYQFNLPYGRTIAPLGQAYDNTTPSDIVRFRQLAQAEGSAGVSWWDWQEASPPEWQAIGQSLPPMSPPGPAGGDASVGRGAKGDLVIWAQEHLNSAGQSVAVDGDFGPGTQQAVQNFQSAHGIAASGVIDTPTWNALLQYPPAAVNWAAGARAAGAGARTGPATARLRAKRYEIPEQPH